MKINDLKDSFDAISPTTKQKDKMLEEILKAEKYTVSKVFNFRKALAMAAGIAAVAVFSVSVYNYGGFNVNEAGNTVVQNVEETGQNEKVDKAKEKKEEKKQKKNIQVASSVSVTQGNIEGYFAETPMPMSIARTVENNEPMEIEENSGISVVSEVGDSDNNQEIAIAVEDELNNAEANPMEKSEDVDEEKEITEDEKEEEIAE